MQFNDVQQLVESLFSAVGAIPSLVATLLFVAWVLQSEDRSRRLERLLKACQRGRDRR